MNTIGITTAFLSSGKEWLLENQTLVVWLGSISIATLILCVFITPLIVIRMGEDYFMEERHTPEDSFREKHPVIRWTTLILKNFLGFILVVAGIIMLALPGQGLLTIFLGLVLMNFPGKRALELRIIRMPGILLGINWIRKKAAHSPLKLPLP